MSDLATRTRQLYDELAPTRAWLLSRDAEILSDQATIAAIPAPTGAEQARAAWVSSRLAASGLDDVHVDGAGNVIATSPGQARDDPVVVCAHLDTVFAAGVPVDVRQRGSRLEAPGIGDNARGLATMLAIAEGLRSTRALRKRPVILAATTGEEGTGDLRGARHLFETTARRAHAAVALDGAGDERIVSCALGCRRYRVTYRGVGGHSWAAFGSANAVHATAELASRLASVSLANRPRTTLTVSRIGGGDVINAIPCEGWLEIDMRSTSDVELARLDRLLHVSAREALELENSRRRIDSPPLAVELSVLGDRPAGEVPSHSPIVEAAAEATRCVGRVPELAIASTDANIPISLGIPAIAIGGGGQGGHTHTLHEWYENREGSRGVVRALLLVTALAAAL